MFPIRCIGNYYINKMYLDIYIMSILVIINPIVYIYIYIFKTKNLSSITKNTTLPEAMAWKWKPLQLQCNCFKSYLIPLCKYYCIIICSTHACTRIIVHVCVVYPSPLPRSHIISFFTYQCLKLFFTTYSCTYYTFIIHID